MALAIAPRVAGSSHAFEAVAFGNAAAGTDRHHRRIGRVQHIDTQHIADPVGHGDGAVAGALGGGFGHGAADDLVDVGDGQVLGLRQAAENTRPANAPARER